MSDSVSKPEASVAPDPMNAKPQKEHQWLQKLVGEWTYETGEPAQPGKPADKATGTESVRSLGDLWVVAEGQGEMPGGGAATTLLTLGYDPTTKRFVGSWIGSMMVDFWTYDGELDSAEKVLTLNSTGPNMTGAGTRQYQDIIELKGDDHRVLTTRMQGDDGTWQQLMRVDYRRKK